MSEAFGYPDVEGLTVEDMQRILADGHISFMLECLRHAQKIDGGLEISSPLFMRYLR